jgi:hypothetical protein
VGGARCRRQVPAAGADTLGGNNSHGGAAGRAPGAMAAILKLTMLALAFTLALFFGNFVAHI